MAQLRQALARKGAEIEALVVKVNPARARLDALHDQINRDEQLLASDTRAQRGVRPAFFNSTSSITQVKSERHSLNSVKSHLDDSIKKLKLARARTNDDRRKLVTHRVDAQHALAQLTRVHTDAKAAITAENATLARVSAELTARLVRLKHHREAQALRASQRAIAAVLAAATKKEHAAPKARHRATASKRGPRLRSRQSRRHRGNGYKNPLRAVGGLMPERIDQGVDYAGAGPVYAIGNGVVLNVYSSGWPNGTFIAYRLSDGPAKGLVVFTAEDLSPQVSVGSTVTANTVIGQMFRGPHGMEIGWADGSAMPNAIARSYGQYHGGNSTAFGYNFSRLLQSLGAPGGVLKNDPTGTMPSGWPQW
jgi:murein DD-endopeptidase MepM/ murein hydrolase activator NlpD